MHINLKKMFRLNETTKHTSNSKDMNYQRPGIYNSFVADCLNGITLLPDRYPEIKELVLNDYEPLPKPSSWLENVIEQLKTKIYFCSEKSIDCWFEGDIDGFEKGLLELFIKATSEESRAYVSAISDKFCQFIIHDLKGYLYYKDTGEANVLKTSKSIAEIKTLLLAANPDRNVASTVDIETIKESLKHCKINIPEKNFYNDFCDGSESVVHSKFESLTNKDTPFKDLKLIFNLFTLLRFHGFRCVALDTSASFLPTDRENQTAHTNINVGQMYDKHYHIFVDLLKYELHEKNPFLFTHSELGFVFTYGSKNLVLSKNPGKVHQVFSAFATVTANYRSASILDFYIEFNPTAVSTHIRAYFDEVVATYFNDSAQKYIYSKEKPEEVQTEQFIHIQEPPLGKEELINDQYVEQLENLGELKWPEGFEYDTDLDEVRLEKIISIIAHITNNLEITLLYYGTVLQKFKTPNKLVYLVILNLLRFLNHNMYGMRYPALPKSEPFLVDVSISANPCNEISNDFYGGHFITVGKSIYSIASKRFKTPNFSKYDGLLCAANTALMWLEANQELFAYISSVQEGRSRVPKFRLLVFEDDLFQDLLEGRIREDCTYKVRAMYKKVLKIVDNFNMEIVYGPTS